MNVEFWKKGGKCLLIKVCVVRNEKYMYFIELILFL